MKLKTSILTTAIIICIIASCTRKERISDVDIIFLHHSVGEYIWHGKPPSKSFKIAKKVNGKLSKYFSKNAALPKLFKEYSKNNNVYYQIDEREFPKAHPYGWNNYPYDYYNIWIKNAGNEAYREEPTLEMLTKDYEIVIFKHCYPVSSIKPNHLKADINSYEHTISNYKLQYIALRDKLHAFPENKFILFTGPVQVKANIKEDEARRTKEFVNWVINQWDLPNDNIFLWNLYELQTEGGLYFRNEFSESQFDSHPNKKFSQEAVQLLFNRIIDVVENEGELTHLTGETKSK